MFERRLRALQKEYSLVKDDLQIVVRDVVVVDRKIGSCCVVFPSFKMNLNFNLYFGNTEKLTFLFMKVKFDCNTTHRHTHTHNTFPKQTPNHFQSHENDTEREGLAIVGGGETGMEEDDVDVVRVGGSAFGLSSGGLKSSLMEVT